MTKIKKEKVKLKKFYFPKQNKTILAEDLKTAILKLNKILWAIK